MPLALHIKACNNAVSQFSYSPRVEGLAFAAITLKFQFRSTKKKKKKNVSLISEEQREGRLVRRANYTTRFKL